MQDKQVLKSLIGNTEKEDKLAVYDVDLAKQFIKTYSKLDFSRMNSTQMKEIWGTAKKHIDNLQKRSALTVELIRSNHIKSLYENSEKDISTITGIKEKKVNSLLRSIKKIEERYGIVEEKDEDDLDDATLSLLNAERADIYETIENTIYKFTEKLNKFSESKLNNLAINILNLPQEEEKPEAVPVSTSTVTTIEPENNILHLLN